MSSDIKRSKPLSPEGQSILAGALLAYLDMQRRVRVDERLNERARIESFFDDAAVDDASRILAMYLDSRGEE